MKSINKKTTPAPAQYTDTKRVLVVEDDAHIVDLMEIHLSDLGYEVDKAYDGRIGLEKGMKNAYDFILLDLMLPSMNGIDICKSLRAKHIDTPILMLTARSERADQVMGLDVGADDYITKPFGIKDFIERIKTIARRKYRSPGRSSSHRATFTFGKLVIDLESREASLNAQQLELTTKEFDLLAFLASHPGKSFNRTDLLKSIWGYSFNGLEHMVNSHINRLRQKIEPDIQNPIYILTTWGTGYRFNEAL